MISVATSGTKILSLSWRDLSHPKMGGAEIFTHEILKALPPYTKVIHLSPRVSDAPREEIKDGIRYIRRGNSFTVLFWAIYYYLKNRKSISQILDQCNTHHFFSPLWAPKSKISLLIYQTTQEIWFQNFPKWFWPIASVGYITERFRLRLYRDCHTFTISDSTRDSLIEFGFSSDKITILPIGLEKSNMSIVLPQQKPDVPSFIYVGRYSPYKGIDDVIKAFILFRKSRKTGTLWIVGKPDWKYVKQKLAPLISAASLTSGSTGSEDIVFWGFVSTGKRNELMALAHALIIPSMREGWGMIVSEAGLLGTPSIAYNKPGIRDAVCKGTAGFLCKDNSPNGILEMMELTISNPDYYHEMAQKAKNFAESLNWEKTRKIFMHSLLK